MISKEQAWEWPISLEDYDLTPSLSNEEKAALQSYSRLKPTDDGPRSTLPVLDRLLIPVVDIHDYIGSAKVRLGSVWIALRKGMRKRGVAYTGWSKEDWAVFVRDTVAERRAIGATSVLSTAYLLCGMRDFSHISEPCAVPMANLAREIFGRKRVNGAIEKVVATLSQMGYFGPDRKDPDVISTTPIGHLFLLFADPRLEVITRKSLIDIRESPDFADNAKRSCYRLSKVLHFMGIIDRPVPNSKRKGRKAREKMRALRDLSNPEWIQWCKRWLKTSTLKSKRAKFTLLTRVGLWLEENHPEIRSPNQWTFETCREYASMLTEMKTGDYTFSDSYPPVESGKPLGSSTKERYLSNVRTFFWDLQNWGWIESNFNPSIALETPPSIGDNRRKRDPRDIDENLWYKLVWASLNLEEEDLPDLANYPVELVRAVAVVWTHAGLRRNEIGRLRLGCVKPQTESIFDEETDQEFPAGTLCYLQVPYSKGAPPYVKPVSKAVEEAIAEWVEVRPPQPKHIDPVTGEECDFLFSFRGSAIGGTYVNEHVIRYLCQKAGVPRSDSRGKITSHRGRSTAVTLLANARNNMSMMDLTKWCGHMSPDTIFHYARRHPHKLAESFVKANETSHMIEILIDQEAVVDGRAAAGEPWKYYDLGHSYCTHLFWSKCPHRLACAGCTFNVPKASSEGQALAAKEFLQRYLEEVPLTSEERSAVEGDAQKFDKMLSKLRSEAAPDGNTPEDMSRPEGEIEPTHLLPILESKSEPRQLSSTDNLSAGASSGKAPQT